MYNHTAFTYFTSDIARQYHFSLLQGIILTHPQAIKTLSAGRIVVLDNNKYRNALAVVLKSTYSAKVRTFTVLALCEQKLTADNEYGATNSCDNSLDNKVQSDWSFPKPVLASHLYQPEGACSQEVCDVTADDISAITTRSLKVNVDRIIDDVRKRQQPRFRYCCRPASQLLLFSCSI